MGRAIFAYSLEDADARGSGGGGIDGRASDGAASAGGVVAEIAPVFVSKDLVAGVSRAFKSQLLHVGSSVCTH